MSSAGEPFSFAKTPGRLPKNVIPSAYHVYLEPSLAEAAIVGRETVDLQITEPVRKLVLNSADLTITSATLRRAGELDVALRMESSDAAELLTLVAPADLSPGACQLDLAWTGQLTERSQGLFITRYTTAAGEKRALASHMEPSDARRMFPCWDEPVFRAVFDLTAVVPQAHMALSNMPAISETALPDGRKEIRFAPTPAMATYLAAFAAGEFEAIEDEAEGVKLRIITTEGKKEQGRYALETTKKVLAYYNDYFGVRYPLPKLDQFCFPAFPAGGMENWGAIFYHDTALLADTATASQANRERVFGVVAHEMAHQWFGDLVTMAWWDDLWLNEGFASWMANKAEIHFHPEWEMALRAASSKEYAMALDARGSTHPIQKPVANEAEASDSFDEITYSKAMSFLRMLEAYLGETAFRDGIRGYLKAHAYGSATTADLWAALEVNPEKPVREVAANWTEQPGFPLIHAAGTCQGGTLELTLSQERFTINQKEAAPLTWQTPITLGPLFAADHAQVVRLGAQPLVVKVGSCDDLPKVNLGGVGYFRVSYDEETAGKLARVITTLPDAERLNLLADTWALVQAGRLPGPAIFELLRRLSPGEASYAVWGEILGVLEFFDDLYVGSPHRAAFRAWAASLVNAQADRLGWEPKEGESELTKPLRAHVLMALGEWESPAILEEAARRFARFAEDRASLPADLHKTVLQLTGRHASAATYEKIHALAKAETATEVKNALYAALGANLEPALAERTLALALTDELSPNEAARLISTVLKEGEHAERAWAFALEHAKAIRARLTTSHANTFLPNLARGFSDDARADELEALAKGSLPEEAAPAVAKAVDDIRFKAEMKRRVLRELETWLRRAEK